MPWIFVGLIYIICITTTEAIHLDDQSFSDMNMEEKEIVVKDILQSKPNISPGKELQCKEDYEQVEQMTSKMISDAKKTVKRLRTLADRLDETWREYQIKYAVATFVCMVGGVIVCMVGGAKKRSLIALGLTIAGIAATFRAASVKDAKDFEDSKMAEKLLNETKADFMDLRRKINELAEGKEYARMIYIYQLAESHKVAHPRVLMMLLETIFNTMGISFNKVIPILKNIGRKVGVFSYEELITVLNTSFLVLDAIDLSFTIMDLVQNKESDSAKNLRAIAKDIEGSFIQ